ncbi:MAG: hypothetical protein K8S25_10430, partial [Alphaproteobacteria bacterium]|nr:hypothetical protein [Alphaproteobacteria bacterium]
EPAQGGSPFGTEAVDKRGIGSTGSGTTVTEAAGDAARCRAGFVWRLARPEDLVCVKPAARDRTELENAEATDFVDPDGAYGPNSCIAGYVWRDAFEGDAVCVTPQAREQVHRENELASKRRAGN